MKINSIILDHKIEAANVLLDITIREYLVVAKEILSKNEFQRKRVIKSIVAKQLKKDLQIGCTIPPIILAAENDIIPEAFDYKNSSNEGEFNAIKLMIENAFEQKKLLVIDGLQRTNVLIDLQKDLKNNAVDLQNYLDNKIRLEIYVGIDKLGILYRMITLNSGQQTMSLRHLVEILYADYQNEKIGDITLVTQKDSIPIPETINDFNFKNIIDGFNAYITGEEQPLNKVSVLDNIQNIKKLSSIRENEKDAFTNFVHAYKKMLQRTEELAAGWHFDETDLGAEYKLSNRPFGKNPLNIFKKAQVIFGFGVALNAAVNFSGKTINEISKEMNGIQPIEIPDAAFNLLLKRLDEVRNNTTISIGAAQRVFFKYFFSALLIKNPYNPNAYMNFQNAINEGMQQTSRELNFKKGKPLDSVYS